MLLAGLGEKSQFRFLIPPLPTTLIAVHLLVRP